MADRDVPGAENPQSIGESASQEPSSTALTRRDLIKIGATATIAASLGMAHPLGAQSAAPAEAGRAFFSAEELALVDELSDMIIPTDEHSPGAKAAKVAGYIDARLAEAWDEKDRAAWRDGLKLVDQLSAAEGGKPFLQSSAERRMAVLTQMAQNEAKPEKPEELFFVELKARVVQAYYTSEIGIKQEMEYKGNSYLAEFVGTDVSSA